MKIISGGQIGADIAALRSAYEVGYETGGWMPKGFKTRDGDKPEYAKTYGMTETSDGGYPTRTRLNVEMADVTIRYGNNFNSYGEKLTARLIGELKKPHIDIRVNSSDHRTDPGPYILADWLIVYRPEVINVAGNSVRSIESTVQLHLTRVLRILKAHGL